MLAPGLQNTRPFDAFLEAAKSGVDRLPELWLYHRRIKLTRNRDGGMRGFFGLRVFGFGGNRRRRR
jgi:hypothetical protein